MFLCLVSAFASAVYTKGVVNVCGWGVVNNPGVQLQSGCHHKWGELWMRRSGGGWSALSPGPLAHQELTFAFQEVWREAAARGTADKYQRSDRTCLHRALKKLRTEGDVRLILPELYTTLQPEEQTKTRGSKQLMPVFKDTKPWNNEKLCPISHIHIVCLALFSFFNKFSVLSQQAMPVRFLGAVISVIIYVYIYIMTEYYLSSTPGFGRVPCSHHLGGAARLCGNTLTWISSANMKRLQGLSASERLKRSSNWWKGISRVVKKQNDERTRWFQHWVHACLLSHWLVFTVFPVLPNDEAKELQHHNNAIIALCHHYCNKADNGSSQTRNNTRKSRKKL